MYFASINLKTWLRAWFQNTLGCVFFVSTTEPILCGRTTSTSHAFTQLQFRVWYLPRA